MCSKFQMAMMGKLSFFLGLQISQSPRGIFLNQSKYALESIKKYGMETCEPSYTLMVEKSKLDEDSQGKVVDPTRYRGMISTLMYLTASRPDLVFAVSFADAGHAGCQDTRKNAEYIALSGCCAQILWMRPQLTDYGLVFNKIPLVSTGRHLHQAFSTRTTGISHQKHGMQSMSSETLKKLADEEEE
ncbi:retrovirus-related pol polyprotein from transposon TNT 1-94 [Tanacetum coccineum]